MRREDMEAVGKAISVIIDKCHSRVIIEPIEPKSLLTLSERNKIITEYEEWCIINNIDGGAESFLDYLCLMEYIHG